MDRTTEAISRPSNTHRQLVLAGGGVAILIQGASAFRPARWLVHVVRDGRHVPELDREFEVPVPVTRHRDEILLMAQAYVAERYGFGGPWMKNRQGDFVPETVNRRFPIWRNSRQK